MRRLVLLPPALLLALAAVLIHRYFSSSVPVPSIIRSVTNVTASPTISSIKPITSAVYSTTKARAMSNSNTTNPPTNILAPWLLPRLTNLYTTLPTEQDDSNFEASFLETFAQSAKVVANHEDTTLDALREHIGAGKFAMARADVDFRDVIEIVKEGGGDKEGLVAGFFVVTRDLKFRIRAGPARRSSFNSFSAKIESDTSIPTTLGDRRRVTEFFITLVDYAAPVHFAHPTGAGASTEVKTVRPEDVEQH